MHFVNLWRQMKALKSDSIQTCEQNRFTLFHPKRYVNAFPPPPNLARLRHNINEVFY